MGLRCENDRERLEALASARARDGSEAVSPLEPTEGAANRAICLRLLLANRTVCFGSAEDS